MELDKMRSACASMRMDEGMTITIRAGCAGWSVCDRDKGTISFQLKIVQLRPGPYRLSDGLVFIYIKGYTTRKSRDHQQLMIQNAIRGES